MPEIAVFLATVWMVALLQNHQVASHLLKDHGCVVSARMSIGPAVKPATREAVEHLELKLMVDLLHAPKDALQVVRVDWDSLDRDLALGTNQLLLTVRGPARLAAT